jgi:hypothetical protein
MYSMHARVLKPLLDICVKFLEQQHDPEAELNELVKAMPEGSRVSDSKDKCVWADDDLPAGQRRHHFHRNARHHVHSCAEQDQGVCEPPPLPPPRWRALRFRKQTNRERNE